MEVSISERSFVTMKLIPVDAIPKVSGYHKLQELIEEFVNGDARVVAKRLRRFVSSAVKRFGSK